ncbi:MAG: TatD family hydrolase [Desulfobulbales bacterium]|nr:TatD family hydrolase [Desulfobulbales bacterium]
MAARKKKNIVYPALGQGVRLIDTHCHLDMDHYHEDFTEIIDRARKHGVDRIITVGIDLASSRTAIRLAEENPGVFAAIGIHPHNVGNSADNDYRQLQALADNPLVVAYGEIGLDFHYNYAPVEVQIEHFTRQVELARQLELPLVVHDRDAHREVLDILTGAGPFPMGGVMHCFSGDSDFARAVVDLGFHLSIPGVVTFKKAAVLQEAVRGVPLERIILETDGPFLAPEPRRGRRNEPALLLFTAQKVAELKGLDLDEVAAATTANAEKLFRLPRRQGNGL